MRPVRLLLLAVRVVLVHPALWATAVRQAGVLAPPGWWRRPPFLPVPDRAYLRFRLQTMYGGDGGLGGSGPASGAAFTAADLVQYLEWCRAWPRVTATSR